MKLATGESVNNVTYQALDEADEQGTLDCPFCGDTDFDRVGLKNHLLTYCWVWAETVDLPVVFTGEEPTEQLTSKEG